VSTSPWRAEDDLPKKALLVFVHTEQENKFLASQMHEDMFLNGWLIRNTTWVWGDGRGGKYQNWGALPHDDTREGLARV